MRVLRNDRRFFRDGTCNGFALLMALIFLLLISMFAVGASEYALLQQRMAGNLRNAQQARMSAESALRGAEYKLWSTANQPATRLHCLDAAVSPDDGCVVYRGDGALYATNGAVTRFQSAAGWIAGIGVSYPLSSNTQEPTEALAKDPVYLIEDLGAEHPPGTTGLHESGNTGPNNAAQAQVAIHMYRITARGVGGNSNTVSVVQSTFDAPVNP
ncbi:PilX N-terminal domain-containing pilus assembly protein [Dyella sp. 2HG41-7]|uniref:pilus assembly PilX family protein n=1 Tax=Dyella sp. 2HG41-7 TaxID=2883239 RepID=UPI002104083D|nr:PilX N-terminal domain-containing pilus assembly protein [Dyella sp. 2HG41-7]